MKLKILAEIAAIVGVVIAFLQYAKIEPNVLDEIPEIYKSMAEDEVKNVITPIKASAYKDNEPIYNLYRAAMSLEAGHSKDIQIEKVVELALRGGDFKLAISSASAVDSDHKKSQMLSDIIKTALASGTSAGHAIIAAELIPSEHVKRSAVHEIIDFYEVRASGGVYGELTNIEKYKEIYSFSDSSQHMDMSSEDAKIFSDNWVENRSYEDFMYFKEVFTFADSRTTMAMTEVEAKSFSLYFIKQFSIEEFFIFKGAFVFADSRTGMAMDEEQAKVFAMKKLKEYQSTKKANNSKHTDGVHAAGV